jgi:hypothetical protein
MLTKIEPLISTENTSNTPKPQHNSIRVSVIVKRHSEDQHNDTATSSKLSSCSVVNTDDYNSSINQHNKDTTTQPADYLSIITASQNFLELILLDKKTFIVKETISSIKNYALYPHLFIDILNSYLIQEKTDIIKDLFFNHNIYTENILYYLLQDQLNGEQNMALIKKLTAKGANLTVDDIASLLQLNDNDLKNQQLKILSECNLLHDILNEAVAQDQLGIVINLYSNHSFATIESLNYLLENLFVNKFFNVEVFNGLIEYGATVTEATLKKLVLSENTKQLNNIIALLVNHPLYYNVLTSILTVTINHNKIATMQMLKKTHTFYVDNSLNFLLLNKLQDNIINIDFINKLIELGAIITENNINQFLTNHKIQVTYKHFLDFYIQLEQINFNKGIKEAIKYFFKHK